MLAILAADRQADLASPARHIGGSKASLASPAEVEALTACVFGAIPLQFPSGAAAGGGPAAV